MLVCTYVCAVVALGKAESKSLRYKGFEDVLQYFAVKQIAADCIITRNKKDFLFSDIQM